MHGLKPEGRSGAQSNSFKKRGSFKNGGATSFIFIISKIKHKFAIQRKSKERRRNSESRRFTRTFSKLNEAFTRFDADRDGFVNPSDLGNLMRSLGGNPTQAQVRKIVKKEKINGPFDFSRFVDLMGKHLKMEPVDQKVQNAFKVIDEDDDGFVPVTDLRFLLTTSGEVLDPDEFDEFIKDMGVGPDDNLTFEDLIGPLVAG